MINKNDILNELIDKQKKDVYFNKKLSYRDLNRIIKYIDISIFGNECCIWNGYISSTQQEKNHYINFFFKNKKTNLQKLLYVNYVGKIDKRDYIKYSCKNGGKCCNINHFIKISSEINKNNPEIENETPQKNIKEEIIDINHEDFIVRF
jgi:hypothetical protein